ncbi:MAG: hypothetical protein ACRYFU_03265, partial [Janthinobacterium lividum]
MVAFDAYRAADDLTVKPAVRLELDVLRPRLKVEQVGKERERFCLAENAQADDRGKLRFKDADRLAQHGKATGVVTLGILRLLVERIARGRLESDAPEQVDGAEARVLVL